MKNSVSHSFAGSGLHSILRAMLGAHDSLSLMQMMRIPSQLLRPVPDDQQISRAEIAFAMNMLLFRDLLARVPEGRAYTTDALASGRQVFFDHGAVRTVDIHECGELPSGEAALARVLLPLGYQVHETYPLTRLNMTGRAYAHQDLSDEMPQFFVSELHVAQFSPEFQAATQRIVGNSVDPLDEGDKRSLHKLALEQELPLPQVLSLLPALLRCFSRQHPQPALADYEIVLRESQEMAWIATEGNAFNHVTDRVDDVAQLAVEQKQIGRSIKSQVEIAARGSVRQTAYRAAEVERVFSTPQGSIVRRVPGSFYEFISRDHVVRSMPDGSKVRKLDLGFDSGNATAIFKMTSVELAAA